MQREGQNLVQNSSVIGHVEKKLETNIEHRWTFIFQIFFSKIDYWRDLLSTIVDARWR